MIYADNAATTVLDIDAFEAMKPYLLGEYGNASQPYSFARSAKKALATARETIANCIGAVPEEIFFTSGGTEGDNWAIKGTMQYGDKRSSPKGHTVSAHGQRYHTKDGVIWKEKEAYDRGDKHNDD